MNGKLQIEAAAMDFRDLYRNTKREMAAGGMSQDAAHEIALFATYLHGIEVGRRKQEREPKGGNMTQKNCCTGCGREEPCGVHYDDCAVLEPGDYVIPRKDAGTSRDHEEHAVLFEGLGVGK